MPEWLVQQHSKYVFLSPMFVYLQAQFREGYFVENFYRSKALQNLYNQTFPLGYALSTPEIIHPTSYLDSWDVPSG